MRSVAARCSRRSRLEREAQSTGSRGPVTPRLRARPHRDGDLPVALVAPLRESSIVIGALVAWLLARDGGLVHRLSGAAVVLLRGAAGVVATAEQLTIHRDRSLARRTVGPESSERHDFIVRRRGNAPVGPHRLTTEQLSRTPHQGDRLARPERPRASCAAPGGRVENDNPRGSRDRPPDPGRPARVTNHEVAHRRHTWAPGTFPRRQSS